jgi:phosphotransacetylase
VTTQCTFERMRDLVANAIEVAQAALGVATPRVAILSANEKQIASLPSTKLAADLTALDWPGAIVYGPLSFDLATDPGSVGIKGIPSHEKAAEVAGRADVLVCPSIDAANILYKTVSAMNKYGIASLANVTVGFPVPYIILSRADTLETRLESIALSSILFHRQRAKGTETAS